MQELVPGGADVAVTNANKLLYIHLVADWHLNGRLGAAAAAFAAGLAQACCLCFFVHSVLTAPKRRQSGRGPAIFFCSEGWQAVFYDTKRPEPFIGSGIALGVMQPFISSSCSCTIQLSRMAYTVLSTILALFLTRMQISSGVHSGWCNTPAHSHAPDCICTI